MTATTSSTATKKSAAGRNTQPWTWVTMIGAGVLVFKMTGMHFVLGL